MKPLLAALSLALSVSLSAQSLSFSIDAKGVAVDGGPHGRVVLGAPTLAGSDKKNLSPTVTVAEDGKSATATYAGGHVITITTSPADGAVLYAFDRKPEGVTAIVINSALSLDLAEGGTFSVNGGQAQPFPAEPGKQLFAQGAFSKVEFFRSSGLGLSFSVPVSYQQMQDPRAWNIQHFQWIYRYDLLRYPESTGFAIQAIPSKAK